MCVMCDVRVSVAKNPRTQLVTDVCGAALNSRLLVSIFIFDIQKQR